MVGVPLYLAVDIGTGSVRVGLFTGQGEKVAYAFKNIKLRNNQKNFYEQSTDDIWRCLTRCVQEVCESVREKYTEYHVAALGVDATCSLVVCTDDDAFEPVWVTADNANLENDEDIYNVMLWLDKRATAEADFINQQQDPQVKVIRSHFGKKLSPENEPPKLLWIKNNRPEVIERSLFFDLADWVIFKCCGNPFVRSSCTLACKWGWGSNVGSEGEWSRAFWENIGLGELCDNDFYKIGSKIVKPGRRMGTLTPQAANEFGLSTDCIVASPMIDAHCGALWSLGLDSPEMRDYAPYIEQRLSVIAGTSTCFIQLSKEPLFVNGVWGPFRNAILPGYHVTEGGQSVTGELLKNTVERHPSFAPLSARVGESNVFDTLAEMTESIVRAGEPDPAGHVHVLDYHAGNRSPVADPTLTGAMTGLTLAKNEFDLAVKYRATVQSLCYGARQITDVMTGCGHEIRILAVCGGLCKSRLFLQELSDCLSLPIALSSEQDTVLLGGAILAKVAHSVADSDDALLPCLLQTSSEMAGLGQMIMPNEDRYDYHSRKYSVYGKMNADTSSYKYIMEGKIRPPACLNYEVRSNLFYGNSEDGQSNSN